MLQQMHVLAVACFKLADTYSEGTIISWFFEILVCKINLDDMCSLKKTPAFFKMCIRLFKTDVLLF